jgi:hypothetical protein
VALALPVSYPVMGWQTTGKASAIRTKSVKKCFTAFPEAVRESSGMQPFAANNSAPLLAFQTLILWFFILFFI